MLQLIFNFDLTLSNAEQLECTALLLHRFTEDLRRRKVASESLNSEMGQPIRLAFQKNRESPPLVLTKIGSDGQFVEEESMTIPVTQASILNAPKTPGFFQIRQGDELLLESGCHFADTREANLQDCLSAQSFSPSGGAAVERTTREDHLWRLWTVLTIGALLVSWHFIKDRPRGEEEHEPRTPTLS